MFVPPEVREGVGFIYCNYNGNKTPAGTVFFLAVRDTTEPDRGWSYAVTSRHVIEDIKDKADDTEVYFRLNRRKGTTEFIETEASDWVFHPTDPMIDVAIFPWAPSFSDFEVRVAWTDSFLTDAIIKEQCVGPGDEVFVTGLFSKRWGLEKNIPIVRIGNIAAMPGELIETKVGFRSGNIRAYLVEIRSLGGLSGSPVFVNLGIARIIKNQVQWATNDRGDPAGVFYLLGLVHGHWDQEVVGKAPFPATDELINIGMAIVVPVQQIAQVLNQPKLVLERQRERDAHMKKG